MGDFTGSNGNAAVGPGSPYRSSVAGSLNGLASRPSLNKELMQKLRSMTETIKMLSDENFTLKNENESLRDELEDNRKSTPPETPASDNRLDKSRN